jgi:hypothetical protein
VWVAGCHNDLLLWPCGHSELKEMAASGVLLRRGVPFLRVGETGGRLASMVNMGVTSKKINGKRCGGPTKCERNIHIYIYIHTHTYIYIYMCMI